MSQSMEELAPIAFKRRNGVYRASVLLADFALLGDDPAGTMKEATNIYEGALGEIAAWRRENKPRKRKAPLTAIQAWELGDIVYRLQAELLRRSCRLDGLYDHLARHAKASKWLGAYVTFRRYVNDRDAIPEQLQWNTIAKRARVAGQTLSANWIAKE